MAKFQPPEQISTVAFNEKYRRLSREESPSNSGPFDTMQVPWVRGMMDALDDPNVWKVVNMKCSQQAWTSAVVVGYMMKRIKIDPCNIAVMFSKEGEFDSFIDEKLGPAVNNTQGMSNLIDISTTRKAGNKKNFRKFPGGFLKLVTSNSPASGKNTTAEIVIVEEPDDANKNVKGQGDAIKNFENRTKQVDDRKIIYGGTSTTDGLSAIQDAYKESDQRKYYVPCHDCGESHVLDWENVGWDRDADIAHEIYGYSRPPSAWYACPDCGSIWDDDQKWQNVKNAEATEGAGWVASGEFRGVAGFGHVSELYMGNHNSRLQILVERYLEAQHKKSQGEIEYWVSFVNNCLGLPFKYESDLADAEVLEDRAEDYQELIVQPGGLIITIGIDVQDDRFAICVRAWGRGEETWLVYWGEIFGKAVVDVTDPVWLELEKICYQGFKTTNGYEIFASGISIDSGDGGTNDAVYGWVRRMNKKYSKVLTMAIKGSTDQTEKEIFSTPARSIDQKTPTKASKYGLKIYIVGTVKSKDLFYRRLQLTGDGAGRVHFYKSVRNDYFDQLCSEIKAPNPSNRRRMIWQKLSGKRREAPDTERYALHAARALKLHLKMPEQWDDVESKLMQVDLFSVTQDRAESVEKQVSNDSSFETISAGSGGGDDWLS